MSNIKTVAKLAGVSPATVSNVFTKNKKVSDETIKRVLEVCTLNNYIPSILASGNITKKMNMIGLFLDTYDDLYDGLVKGVTIECAKKGRRVILYIVIKDYNELNSILRQGCQPIDGAILILPQYFDMRIDKLNEAMVPYVLIGNPGLTHQNTSFVDADNVEKSYSVTQKLLELGHENIAFINYKEGYTVTEDRRIGYIKAFNDYGLEVNPKLMINDDITETSGENCILELFREKIEFSAVIVSMPIVAKGVYTILNKNGLDIGKDVSVISFNKDIYDLKPKLSYVDIDFCELGCSASIILNDIIDNNLTEKIEKIIDTSTKFFESCGQYNQNIKQKFDQIYKIE
jgi:DNA-binding LacI/PurR family transcriptional regulator